MTDIQPSARQILPALPDNDIDYLEQVGITQDIIYNQGGMVFKLLDATEKLAFRKAARENYVPFTTIEGIWHPIYQDECVRINHERAYYRTQPGQ